MAQVLPFYLVCDVSASMHGEEIAALNDAVREIHTEISENINVRGKAWLCLIGFASRAHVVLPLTRFDEVETIDTFTAGGGTNYAETFELLYATINRDLEALRADGHQVFRPAVFFLTDGYPSDDDWYEPHARLTDPEWKNHPEILSFGFGEGMNQDIVRKLATTIGYLADGMEPAKAIRELARILADSIVKSVTKPLPGGELAVVPPKHVRGFTALPASEI